MSDSNLGMRWYIVHTMSNYEKKAGDAIRIPSKNLYGKVLIHNE